jgi:hypothetical protein
MNLFTLVLIVFLVSCESINNSNENGLNSKDSLSGFNDSLEVEGSDSSTVFNSMKNFIPDVKVNNLELSNPASILKNVGDLRNMMIENTGLPYYTITNKNKKATLTMISFTGSGYNDIYQFIIEDNYSLEKNKYTSYNDFVTESDLKLGISKSEIIKIKGGGYSLKNEGNLEILTYRISDYNSSQFLKKYNLPSYFMEFSLREDKVLKIKFGFNYP